MKHLVTILIFHSIFLCLNAQQIDSFSLSSSKFLSEFEPFFTASDSKSIKTLYTDFSKEYKSGAFDENEQLEIIAICNKMLQKKMPARPYFESFVKCLTVVNKGTNDTDRFDPWMDMLNQIIDNFDDRKFKPFLDFTNFSFNYFESNALRYSTRGVSWYALGQTGTLKYEGGQALVVYNKVDLTAVRKNDSIQIRSTSGIYYTNEGKWKGQTGVISWDRLGLDDVFATLTDYEIEFKSSLYRAENVKLSYPLFFGNQQIEGHFEDKLVTANAATEGSYPRFLSYNEQLNIQNIGSGISYAGGFRLEGTTVYGYGTKDNPARLAITDKSNKRIYKGLSQLYTIRSGERIVSQSVESTIYNGNDSIHHPSVNIRLSIPKNELALRRGDSAKDQNPFFSSYHQVNIEVDNMIYYLEGDSIAIGKRAPGVNKEIIKPVIFESLLFFSPIEHRRIQGLNTYNPLSIIKAVGEREGNIVNAYDLAPKLNPKYSVENIQTLLFDLVAKGFINYDVDNQMIEIKEKVYHYTNSSNKKVDFDFIQIVSKTQGTNGIIDLNSGDIIIFGVQNVEFSATQQVAFQPKQEVVILKRGRNTDFSGVMYAGFSILTGNDWHFDYAKNQIVMDTIRYFDIYIPTGVVSEKGVPEALSIASRIENFEGVLLIDAPSNKSGREDIPTFPSLQSRKNAFVYYDKDQTLGGIYKRDSFYFQLDPFSFNNLDKLTQAEVQFKGQLISSDIFPPINETIKIQEDDKSLGFLHQTPMPLPTYSGKGNYKGNISLSDKGLLCSGKLDYIGAKIHSEDLIFTPKQAIGSADNFNLEESTNDQGIDVPQVNGVDIELLWKPYADSLYLDSKEAPFDFFKTQGYQLAGTTILTSSGVKGIGKFTFPQANMNSNIFEFGKFSVNSDTTDLFISAFDSDALALSTTNLIADVDFIAQTGAFTANNKEGDTELPANQYKTSFNEFIWDMQGQKITFTSGPNQKGLFTSTHPNQDSLNFEGQAATFDLASNQLIIDGVENIISADAFIFPENEHIEIAKGGDITQLSYARIEADTINRYHVINRATVDILGRKNFKASGFYEYNIADKQQEIKFDEIIGSRIGKGRRSKKATATRASGTVEQSDNFLIDDKIGFRGTISLFSESPKLKFDGFAILNSSSLRKSNWFTVAFDGDKTNLAIQYTKPTNTLSEPLSTGLYIQKENSHIYPSIMAPLSFRKDRAILPVIGYLRYYNKNDQFIFGDSLKVLSDGLVGNKLVYNEKDGNIEMEGKFNLANQIKYVSVTTGGRARIKNSTQSDTTSYINSMVLAEFMMGINLLLPEELQRILIADFEASSFDATNINYTQDLRFYKKASAEIFGIDAKEAQKIQQNLAQGRLDIPKKLNTFDLLLGKTNMTWDSDYQSFVNTNQKLNIASIGGQPINKSIVGYLEVKMPSNNDDRLYLYLKSPSGSFYFFGFKQGILNIVSDNTRFNDFVITMKEKDRVKKMKDGDFFEFQSVNQSTARQFISRVQAASN